MIGRRRSLSRGKGITLMQTNFGVTDFKKNHLPKDVDLTFINSRSDNFVRKYR
jgi:hypothetical protein